MRCRRIADYNNIILVENGSERRLRLGMRLQATCLRSTQHKQDVIWEYNQTIRCNLFSGCMSLDIKVFSSRRQLTALEPHRDTTNEHDNSHQCIVCLEMVSFSTHKPPDIKGRYTAGLDLGNSYDKTLCSKGQHQGLRVHLYRLEAARIEPYA